MAKTYVGGDNDHETTPVGTQPLPKRPRSQGPTTATPLVTPKFAASTSKYARRRIVSSSEEEEEENAVGQEKEMLVEKCCEKERNGLEPDEVEGEEPIVANVDGSLNTTMGSVVITLGDPDLLDCPICLEHLRPPVYQCNNGHLGCELCCKGIRNKCPSCSLPIGFNRCRVIERVVESALTSCVYVQHGCTEKISYLKKLDHENTCKFTPISCPERGCEYIGVSKCFYVHFTTEHPGSSLSTTLNTVKYIYVVRDAEHILLHERSKKLLFVLSRVLDPLGSFVNVTCVAPTESDTKFSYHLTATCGENSITLKSSMELTPDCFARPAKEKCLLIRNDFHKLLYGFKLLVLEIVIRKVC